ncbi:hypothetical protein [Mesorhizobium sp. Pch-S]|uniref:hypothetical protein n=1 Tax=Mesorhizobium sp. Pch-S TaxID=2082387 RepID=UPI001011E6FC|nr:hypothetical protein [Mesorhizobium sp. Pch-S]QAZ46801.1 hypothetical protein C1M53_31610 [Mesorhizobium sp. Pch-S]
MSQLSDYQRIVERPQKAAYDARIAQLERELADIKEALELGKPFGFDPATGFIQADDGGSGDHCVFYVPKIEAVRDLAEARAINANLMGDDENKPRYTTKRLKQEIAKAVAAAEAERDRLAAEVERLSASADIRDLKEHWHSFCDADPFEGGDTFAERMEARGLIELVAVTQDALEDGFATERGIMPGGSMWQLTEAGRASLQAGEKGE